MSALARRLAPARILLHDIDQAARHAAERRFRPERADRFLDHLYEVAAAIEQDRLGALIIRAEPHLILARRRTGLGRHSTAHPTAHQELLTLAYKVLETFTNGSGCRTMGEKAALHDAGWTSELAEAVATLMRQDVPVDPSRRRLSEELRVELETLADDGTGLQVTPPGGDEAELMRTEDARDIIQALVEEAATNGGRLIYSTIAERSGVSPDMSRKRLAKLYQFKYVDRLPRRGYLITDKGKRWAAENLAAHMTHT